jgi:membrane-associated phospholipid phosphatase
MRLAQPEVISYAHWIAAHAPALLLIVFLTALGVMSALWHLLETRLQQLWAYPDGRHQSFFERPFAQWIRQRHPRVWRFFVTRFAHDRDLRPHLTVGFLVTLVAIAGFSAVAAASPVWERSMEFDRQLGMSLNQHLTSDHARIFRAITWCGDYRTLFCLGLAVSLRLLVSRLWSPLIGWVLALNGSWVLGGMLKSLFRRLRLELASSWLTDPAWSVPSGHAMGSLVAYGMLAYVLIAVWRVRFPRIIIAASAALVLAIDFSQLYLGAHFFSDVAAGYVAAVTWLGICVSGCEFVRLRERKQRFLSQLLTNKRSKAAIEVALLSRRLQELSFSASFAKEADFAVALASARHYGDLRERGRPRGAVPPRSAFAATIKNELCPSQGQ